MMDGETLAGRGPCKCSDCKDPLPLKVLQSAAGFYIGLLCKCGPYSRESGYYSSKEEATTALATGHFSR